MTLRLSNNEDFTYVHVRRQKAIASASTRAFFLCASSLLSLSPDNQQRAGVTAVITLLVERRDMTHGDPGSRDHSELSVAAFGADNPKSFLSTSCDLIFRILPALWL